MSLLKLTISTMTIAVATITTVLTGAAAGDVLWDNGPMVTHPGAHPSGEDLSVNQPGSASGGNVGTFGTGTYFRRADDFAVDDPSGWNVERVRIYLYSNSNLPTDPTGIDVWEGMNMNIWRGMPGSGHEVLMASSTTSTTGMPQFTGIYRVSSGDPAATDKPVFAVDVLFEDVTLPKHEEYWIDYQVKSNSLDGHSAWTLIVMDVDESGNPISKPGNSRQIPVPVFGTEWETWIHAPFNHTFELAFQVHGAVVAAPTVPGDLNGDGVVNVLDLIELLGAWGPCPARSSCPADLDGSGEVNLLDLLLLLNSWG